MRSLVARLAAAAFVAAAAVVVALPAGPAAASYCSDGGVSVLVDASAMGSGAQQECGPGPKASNAFKDDFTLTGYRGDPAYVCQIDGLPVDGDCRQTDAYWALFVSRAGGAWTYATQGAYSLEVADGDSVAFVWQDSASRRTPGAAPAVPAPVPTSDPAPASPTKQPTKQPTREPTRQASSPTEASTGSPSADPSSAATPTSGTTPSAGLTTSATAGPSGSPALEGKRKRKQGDDATVPTPAASPSASPTAPADAPSLAPAADQGAGTGEDEGLPAWLALVALLLVGVGTGAVVIRRRRSSPGP